MKSNQLFYMYRPFSLIELLVVVSLFSILASLIQPSLSQFLTKSKVNYCSSKLKQLGMAISLYLEDNYGRFMSNQGAGTDGSWDYLLRHYDGRGQMSIKVDFDDIDHHKGIMNEVYLCPSDDLMSSHSTTRLRKTYGPNAYQPETDLDATNIRRGLVPVRGTRTDNGKLSENIFELPNPDQTLLMSGIKSKNNNINTVMTDSLTTFVRVKNAHNQSHSHVEMIFLHEPWYVNLLFVDGRVNYSLTHDALKNQLGNIPSGSSGQNTIFDARKGE